MKRSLVPPEVKTAGWIILVLTVLALAGMFLSACTSSVRAKDPPSGLARAVGGVMAP